MALHIVLVNPEIPNNTGNIGRLSLVAGAHLHLVKPFGFELSDARVKRAGLDYWPHVSLFIHDSWEDFYAKYQDENLAFFSSHGENGFWDLNYTDNMFLIFGKESAGLPKDLIENNQNRTYKIPIASDKVRSLNLANAVSVVVFEGLRQLRGE
jgi:tRNA (cytidine/uridine-2'-O-)-methyltransferase